MLNRSFLVGLGVGRSRAPHRYWRIHSVSSPGHSYFGFHNIEMRGVSGGPDLTGSGTAIYGGGGLIGSVSQCFDSDCDSVSAIYNAVYPPGAWIGYDFGVATEINEIFISWFTSVPAPTDLTVEYSDNGTDWVEDKLFGTVPWGGGSDPICSKTYPWAVLTL